MSQTNLERRQFFGALAAGAAGLGLMGCPSAQGQVPAAALPPDDEWARVRAEFNLSPKYIHLAGFLLASHPRPVREAIERHRRALDDNPALYVEQHFGVFDEVQKAAAAYLGAKPEEIALTDSTTMGLAILYAGLPLAAGDELITTTHDHYATHESLRLATLRAAAELRKVPLYERSSEATPEAMAAAIQKAITSRTRVVAITWVHSSTGVRTPVRAIADRIAAANAQRAPEQRILLCVDGVHGFGVEDVTMADLGCDFFSAGTHKWIFGPRGTGILWGRAEHWARLRPTIPSFGRSAYEAWMKGAEAQQPTTADMVSPGGFHSFEHRWALGEAFQFHLGIGKRKVAERIHELNRQCKQGLAGMNKVTLHTPQRDDASAGIITFEIAGLEPKAIVDRLLEKGIVASTTPYATSYARLAPGLLNTPQEIERTLAELKAMAG